jgi:CxxC motif-containing protein (DUF1111 family)
MGGRVFLFVLLVVVVALVACGCARVLRPGDPLPGLRRAERDAFERGRLVFERSFAPETGLGPLFNAESCAECHEDPGSGGVGDEIELHAARFGAAGPVALAFGGEDTAPPRRAQAGCDLLFAEGGPVYQQQVTPALRAALGIDSEPVPADAQTAHRTSPDVFGFGLLDAVTDATILSRADPDDDDEDGISGRPNRFVDGRIGRFGRKAFVPTLSEFNAGAFQIELGITVAEAPDEGTVGGQPLPPGVDPTPDPELDAESVQLANAFVRFLAPPSRRTPTGKAARGKRVFDRIGCAECHVPKLRTGPSPVRALANRDVAAYTDLLLHDMGPELADICFGDAAPSEFRTEPLMGLRFSTRFLHDGRATSIEDAIRLHGGEAASSRAKFLALSDRDRAALVAFLSKL